VPHPVIFGIGERLRPIIIFNVSIGSSSRTIPGAGNGNISSTLLGLGGL